MFHIKYPKLTSTQRYKKLFSKMIRLEANVSSSTREYKLVYKVVDDLNKLVKEIQFP